VVAGGGKQYPDQAAEHWPWVLEIEGLGSAVRLRYYAHVLIQADVWFGSASAWF
jgi:hypothetical protein